MASSFLLLLMFGPQNQRDGAAIADTVATVTTAGMWLIHRPGVTS